MIRNQFPKWEQFIKENNMLNPNKGDRVWFDPNPQYGLGDAEWRQAAWVIITRAKHGNQNYITVRNDANITLLSSMTEFNVTADELYDFEPGTESIQKKLDGHTPAALNELKPGDVVEFTNSHTSHNPGHPSGQLVRIVKRESNSLFEYKVRFLRPTSRMTKAEFGANRHELTEALADWEVELLYPSTDNKENSVNPNIRPKFVKPSIVRTEVKSKFDRIADIHKIAADKNIPITGNLAAEIDAYYAEALK